MDATRTSPNTPASARSHGLVRLRWIAVIAALVAAAGVSMGIAGPARAASVNEIAASLESESVYNDPAAQNALTSAQVGDLQTQISQTGLAIFIAVVPESTAAAAGGPDALLRSIISTVGQSGAYALIAGDAFRAGGTGYSVRAIADEAFADERANGPFAVLQAFVAGVDARYGSGASGGSSSSGSGFAVLIFLAIVIAAIIAITIWIRRSARKRRELWAAQMREVLDEDITELGERLGRFDHTDPRIDDYGRAQLQSALDAYTVAGRRSATLAGEADVAATTKALDDGRYAIACVEASMNGAEPPVRRAPCFFDPRHGVSLDDVMWSPSTGPAHEVPACAACVSTISSGGYPQPREVEVAGVRQPYWEAGGQFAPYARGYFSGFGSTMLAAFAGTMIAQSLFTPSIASAATFDSGSFSSGGDFGGGGFGGGDFGGGGFGGGDFGGGDF